MKTKFDDFLQSLERVELNESEQILLVSYGGNGPTTITEVDEGIVQNNNVLILLSMRI